MSSANGGVPGISIDRCDRKSCLMFVSSGVLASTGMICLNLDWPSMPRWFTSPNRFKLVPSSFRPMTPVRRSLASQASPSVLGWLSLHTPFLHRTNNLPLSSLKLFDASRIHCSVSTASPQIHLPNFRCWSRSGTCAECCPVIWALCGERDSPRDGQAALLVSSPRCCNPVPGPTGAESGRELSRNKSIPSGHRQRSSLGCDVHHINGVWSGEAWLEMPRPRRRM
ncbi:hypothetical protein EDB80DRAFT_153902 [Ilyonectria destructans]|nr:hypothetical protein EDB80DRAFT_153902 [Ilyonectria destructans]